MADPVASRRLAYRLLLVAILALVMFVKLMPLSPGPGSWPAPDLLLLITVAWVLRRPDYVPVVLVALVFLLADLLFLRPPGLWAAIVVLATEFLRSREPGWRDIPFLLEWGIVAGVLTVATLFYSAVLAVFFVDQPRLGLTLLHVAITIAAYPLVVLLTARALGLRKAAPGEVDQLGHRQ
ncbi:MAG: rod shape-determining protein MreD [Rhodobacteraceae bacterium]|jgi:rod shape-determining protein MreD|nr:rod shape-determining protein MreD [Paracoccaceae bacterium]